MAKAGKKSTTSKRRRSPTKSKPERSLYERLKDYPLKPLRLSPERLADARRQEAELQAGRHLLDRAMAAKIWGHQFPRPRARAARSLSSGASLKAWVVEAVEFHPPRPGETMMDYAKRLEDFLQRDTKANPRLRREKPKRVANDINKIITASQPKTIAARLYELGLGPRRHPGENKTRVHKVHKRP
jgi:hypothetical protein